ncbi:hypothetical protein ACHAW5_006560 [Stephanodiscus triporus]|uniref:Uncharacterized protein n=1 Tax=Stephanodiscus triporus TaxID=2934178 RepID=A0ABD3MJ23_9STRA
MVQVQHPSNVKSSTRRWSASTVQCLLVSTALFVLCLYLGLALSFARHFLLLGDDDDDDDGTGLVVPAGEDAVRGRGGRSTGHAPVPRAAAMECLMDDNYDGGGGGGGRGECCFSWGVDLDEWRTHHPDWGVTRSESDAYCLSKFEEPKAAFFRGLNTSKWMYATNDTSSWGFCDTTDLNCYILPIGNCMNTFGVNDPVKGAGPSTPNYTWIYEYLMRFNHRAMYHIQKRIDEASHVVNLGDNCTVIHVRRGDSGMPRGSHRKYVGLVEFIREGGIGPGDPVLILTDDETTIYEAETFYPEYNWIYIDRPRVNITYGGWEGLIPSGDEVQEFVAIYAEMLLASRCNRVVHGQSGFIRELKSFCEMVRRGRRLPSQEYHLIEHKFGNSTEKKRCQSMGKHYCAERMIEEIYREAAKGLKNRKYPTSM